MGVKDYVPPYLDPNLTIEELISGVSFASGGTGYDPMTAQIGVIYSLSLFIAYSSFFDFLFLFSIYYYIEHIA